MTARLKFDHLSPHVVACCPVLADLIEAISTISMGKSVKLVEKGLHAVTVQDTILSAVQPARLLSSLTTTHFCSDRYRSLQVSFLVATRRRP